MTGSVALVYLPALLFLIACLALATRGAAGRSAILYTGILPASVLGTLLVIGSLDVAGTPGNWQLTFSGLRPRSALFLTAFAFSGHIANAMVFGLFGIAATGAISVKFPRNALIISAPSIPPRPFLRYTIRHVLVGVYFAAIWLCQLRLVWQSCYVDNTLLD